MFGRNAAMPRSAFDAWMTILPYKSHVRVHVPPDTRTCSNREEREHWVPTQPPPGTPLLVGEPLRRICSCHCEQKENWFHSLANRYVTARIWFEYRSIDALLIYTCVRLEEFVHWSRWTFEKRYNMNFLLSIINCL